MISEEESSIVIPTVTYKKAENVNNFVVSDTLREKLQKPENSILEDFQDLKIKFKQRIRPPRTNNLFLLYSDTVRDKGKPALAYYYDDEGALRYSLGFRYEQQEDFMQSPFGFHYDKDRSDELLLFFRDSKDYYIFTGNLNFKTRAATTVNKQRNLGALENNQFDSVKSEAVPQLEEGDTPNKEKGTQGLATPLTVEEDEQKHDERPVEEVNGQTYKDFESPVNPQYEPYSPQNPQQVTNESREIQVGDLMYLGKAGKGGLGVVVLCDELCHYWSPVA